MSHPSRSPIRPLVAALGLPALLLAACGSGDPTCIFTSGGCQGGPGGPGAQGDPATLPVDFQTILSGKPTIQRVVPDGAAVVSSTTPVVLVFSESMSPSILDQIDVVALDVGGFPTGPVPASRALVADGRVLLILPTVLPPTGYIVQAKNDAVLTDLQGQRADVNPGATLANFQVDVDDPEAPTVVDTFPAGGAARFQTTQQIVTVFDRPMDPATVNSLSFLVEVGGVPPVFDPPPVPLTVDTGFVPIVDTRVFLYRSVDGDGNPASLGTGVTVDVTLSPPAFPMLEQVDPGEMADPLAQETFSFQTQDIEAPLAGTIMSLPADAIGITNLTAGGPDPLMVEVSLDAGLADDVLTLILFGLDKSTEPELVALSETKVLSGGGTITTVMLDLGETGLADGAGKAKLADGTVAFAFSLRRGSQTTPVRLLDVDVVAGGIQDPILDTVAPTVEEFLHPGGATDFARSDQRDIVITGDASEELRDVEVIVAGRPTVTGLVGSDEDGLFIAPPVSMPAGIAVGPMDFDLRVFDVALNASPTVSGTFNQLGAVGPTLLASPGDPITVEVFDALTLEPVDGANVFTHSDVGDMLTFALVDTDMTVGGAPATVFSAGAGAVATILTVEATGYDIFTYHGVITDRISVPVTPSVTLPATTTGDLTTTSEIAALSLDLIDRRFDDTRRIENATPVFPGSACVTDPFGGSGIACPYGPEPILPARIGALSFVGGNFALDEASFSAAAHLQAFDLVVPVPEAPAASLDLTSIDLAFLLNEPGVPTEELPIELPPTSLDASVAFLLDTTNLSDDADTTGSPRITVDTIVPGVPGSVSVGFGLAFENAPLTTWNVRAAYPGAVGPAGFFGMGGVVDTDLFLRAELRENDLDRSGRRVRMSDLAGLSPFAFVLFAPDLPEVGSPTVSSGGVSYNVVFNNAIVDLAAQTGLYRVTLTDTTLRRWTLWRDDPPDPDTAFVHLPDLSPTGTPLANGPITCVVTGWAWPTLSLDAFLFSDVEREHDIFCETAPIVFNQP